MKNFENFTPRTETPERLIENFDTHRIVSDDPSFSALYSTWQDDQDRAGNLKVVFDSDDTDQTHLGKVAEALIFKELTNHELSQHLTFRGASLYDDYFNGVDVVVEPKSGQVQALATLDITINQADIKGDVRRNTEAGVARPVGLEQKLARAKRYVDTLASYDPGHAREILGWMQSGGLHEPVSRDNRAFFSEAEKLMLLKYYKTPEGAAEPDRPGFVVGGPQVIVSADTMFVNQALQGHDKARQALGDLAAIEFAACIEAAQDYNNRIVKSNRSRNVLFDTHFSKVRAWQLMFAKPEVEEIVNNISRRNQTNRDFGLQLQYYARTFEKIFGRS